MSIRCLITAAELKNASPHVFGHPVVKEAFHNGDVSELRISGPLIGNPDNRWIESVCD